MLDSQDKEMYEAIIARYVAKNEEQFRAWQEDVIKRREELKDEEFALIEGKQMRYAMNMPVVLHNMIRAYKPEFLAAEEDVRDFLKEFPGFQVPEKI